jgi:3-dehydroquinate synthetase
VTKVTKVNSPTVPLIRLEELPQRLKESPWHLITEPTVWAFHQKAIEAVLGPCDPIIVPAGDASKTLAQVEDILGQLIKRGLNRQHQLIAFGGGAVCDLGAFVAAVALRGIDHFLIPSTLLAQVDAAHGGKTAVNLPEGKNLCGAFKWAEAIVIEQFFLDTLPEEEMISGKAEVYKTALIAGGEIYEEVISDKALDTELLQKIAAVKNEIVRQDPFEENIRAHLNLGHTAGHAIEAQKSHNHGECVGMGMRFALRLGEKLGFLKDEALIDSCDQWLVKNGLPLDPKDFSRESFFTFMRADKKQSNSGLKWIFVESPGKIVSSRSATQEAYDAVLDQLNW